MTPGTHVKALWIDRNNDADYARLKARGIETPVYESLDPRITSDYLDSVAGRGFKPAIAVVWNWFPGLDGKGFAEKCDAELRRIGWAGNPTLLADIEVHDVGYILDFFFRWRQLRPKRATWWTFEGFQGGLFWEAAVKALVAANVRFQPQFYDGNMGALGHSPIMDLLIAGFPGDRIDGCYDAAVLPYLWRGTAFSQGRLP